MSGESIIYLITAITICAVWVILEIKNGKMLNIILGIIAIIMCSYISYNICNILNNVTLHYERMHTRAAMLKMYKIGMNYNMNQVNDIISICKTNDISNANYYNNIIDMNRELNKILDNGK